MDVICVTSPCSRNPLFAFVAAGGRHDPRRQLPSESPREIIMADARYYVVGDHDVWMIKFEDGEYGPYASRDDAIDAAQKLGTRGERPCVRGG